MKKIIKTKVSSLDNQTKTILTYVLQIHCEKKKVVVREEEMMIKRESQKSKERRTTKSGEREANVLCFI